MSKTSCNLRAFSWNKFSWTEMICVKKLTLCNSAPERFHRQIFGSSRRNSHLARHIIPGLKVHATLLGYSLGFPPPVMMMAMSKGPHPHHAPHTHQFSKLPPSFPHQCSRLGSIITSYSPEGRRRVLHHLSPSLALLPYHVHSHRQ